MRLFYFHDPEGNFGDDLNNWLWDELLPGWREAWPEHVLVGVGTLLNDRLPRGVRKIVCGSGVGYGALPDAGLLAECEFVSVRGPRSAAALGLPREAGILDAGALLPRLARFRDVRPGDDVVLIPHHRTLGLHDWERICGIAGVRLVSPCQDADVVIRAIAGARLVLAESMHAAIIADAFGVPWHGVGIGPQFNGAKWLDWADSLNLKPEIQVLAPPGATIWALRRMLGRPARAGAAGDGRGAAHGPPEGGRFSAVRRRVDAEWLGRQLQVMAMEPGRLSDRSVLARQQEALLAAFRGLAARF